MNKGIIVALAALALAGCASKAERQAARSRNPAPCPNISVLADAARLVDFTGGQQDLSKIAWSAEIEGVSLSCRYFSDKPIEVEVNVDLAFGRGPAAEANAHEYSYFVAVTRTDREVIAKESFAVPVKFGANSNIERRSEDIEKILIPRSSEETAGLNFEVIVGLVLTPEQVIYNRSGKSLKFPELD